MFTETWVSNSLGLHGAREPHDTRKGNAWYPSQGYLKRISFRLIFVPDSKIKSPTLKERVVFMDDAYSSESKSEATKMSKKPTFSRMRTCFHKGDDIDDV